MLQRMGKGYLEGDFRVFHLKDIPQPVISMHCHDFRQIVVLIGGAIDYALEDQRYSMRAGNVMLVEAGRMHRPVLSETDSYERVVICLSQCFFAARPGLDELFLRAAEHQNWMLCASPQESRRVMSMAVSLSDAACSHSRFPLLLQQSRMNEFLIELNDIAAAFEGPKDSQSNCNENVSAAIRHINEHLTEDLCTAKIAESIGLTESYLMHLFKKETGMTLRSYVTKKRLYLSNHYMGRGRTAAEACALSGFASYSSFYRAYVEKYGISPKNMDGQDRIAEEEPEE